MMKEALKDIRETARQLLHEPRTMLLFIATYIAMLAAATLFITTREATVNQVLVTFATLLAAPALFFLLQAMCVSYTETNALGEVLRRSVKNFWKLMLASIPVILCAIALYLLLWKIESAIAGPHQTPRAEWPRIIFSTLRVLLFGFAMPLVCIHLWIALMGETAGNVLRRLRPLVGRAFAPRSVKTYACGVVLFGILPYLLFISRTPFERAWLELTLLGTRLIVAFTLILFGWVITVGAMKKGLSAEG